MEKALIAFYIGFAFMATQFLFSWHLKKDQILKDQPKDQLNVGLHFGLIRRLRCQKDYKFGYWSGICIFVFVFIVILLPMLTIMPPLTDMAFEDLFRNHFWLPICITVVGFLITFIGASASQIILNMTAVVASIALFYAASAGIGLDNVLKVWLSLWPVFAFSLVLGIYWVTHYQKDRLEEHRKIHNKSDILLTRIYYEYVIYYFGVLIGWIVPFGLFFSILLVR